MSIRASDNYFFLHFTFRYYYFISIFSSDDFFFVGNVILSHSLQPDAAATIDANVNAAITQ